MSGVRELILGRRLPVGSQLPSETELMARFQVGRVTVREALRLLERDGLVEIRRGTKGGIFVRHPEIGQVSEAISLMFAVQGTTLREFVEFRMLVEPAAAAMAAGRIDAAHCEQLATIADGDDDDLDHVPDLHLLIAEATGNGVLAMALTSLHHPFGEHFRPNRISHSELKETAAAHRKVARRVLAGDAKGARRAMRIHLDAYHSYLAREDLLDHPIIPERGEWVGPPIP